MINTNWITELDQYKNGIKKRRGGEREQERRERKGERERERKNTERDRDRRQRAEI